MKENLLNLKDAYIAPEVRCVVLNSTFRFLAGSGKPGDEIVIVDDEW